MQQLLDEKEQPAYFYSKILIFMIILAFPIAGILHEFFFRMELPANSGYVPIKEISTGWEYAWGNLSKNDLDYLPKGNKNSTNTKWTPAIHPINPPGRKNQKVLWLKCRMPEAQWKLPTILISGKGVLLTFKAFVDNDLIYSFGELNSLGEGTLPGVTSHLIPLKKNFNGKTLTLKIFSDYANIGIRGKVFFGSRPDLIKKTIKEDTIIFSLGLFMVLLGCIDLFTYRKSQIDAGPASMLGVLALSLGLYTITSTTLKDVVFFAPVFWFNIYITSLTLASVGSVGFIWQTFKPVRGNYLYWIWQFQAFYAIICQAVFLLIIYSVLPMKTGNLILTGLRVFLIFDGLLMIWITAKEALFKKSSTAIIYLLGLLPVIISGIRGVLVGLDKVKSTYSYFPFTIILFVLSLEIIQRRKNIKTQQRLLNYSRELEKKSKEKEALISDLHDGIGGLVTNIKFLAEMGIHTSTIEGMKESLSSISELSSDSLIEIGNFMQSLDEEVGWETVVRSFNSLGSKIISSLGLSFSFEQKIDKRAKEPDSILFLNLLRIFKESLTNIVKHANAKSVRINLDVTSEKIYLSIEDDGIGFGSDIIKGRGLNSMKARARKLGGTLSITSNSGTFICLELNQV